MPDLKALLKERVKKTGDMLKKEVKKEPSKRKGYVNAQTTPKD